MKKNIPAKGLAGLVIVIIDMQWGYLCYREFRERRKKLIAAQQGLLQLAAKEDIPLIVLEHALAKEPTIGELALHIVDVPRRHTITKPGADGFKGTELHRVLQQYNPRSLVLAGVQADVCVLETARSAKKLGYRLISSPSLIDNQLGGKTEETNAWYRRRTRYPESLTLGTLVDLCA